MIQSLVFKAFYSNLFSGFSDQLELILICDVLHLSYNQLIKQPSWWVNQYIHYLMGKNRAEEALTKKKSRKSQPRTPIRRARR